MSSLVDYEDSEDEREEPASVSKHFQLFTSQKASSSDWIGSRPHGDPLTRSSQFLLRCPPGCETTETAGDLSIINTDTVAYGEELLPTPVVAVPSATKLLKRPLTGGSAVRPYIPKRLRLSISAEVACLQPQAGCSVQNHTNKIQRVLETSDRLEPYLDEQVQSAGIPRRLKMRLEGHHGPVNRLQWCPVPRFSHLLLSASMDKTFKVWDAAETGQSIRVYTGHTGAVRDACWTPCGQRILTGSFDSTAVVTDVETGKPMVKVNTEFRVTCVALLPSNPEVFLFGGHNPAVKAFDSRCGKVVKVYKAEIQQTLELLFLRDSDFITSSDSVSRDSADRTLMAWDFQTTARVSNQIFHERYTCPSLALHPVEDSFVAQTNGNYIALFSTQRPYSMNKRRRFEGHKVEGYAVQCSFSADGTILASGSSSGCAHFYDYHTGGMRHTMKAHCQPCLSVVQHRVLPATVATGDWAGEVKVWS